MVLNRTIFRLISMMSLWEESKGKFLTRSMEQRLLKGAITIKDVPSWNEFYKSNEDHLANRPVQQLAERFNIKISEPCPEINELVSVWRGDITKLAIDAIVNAANKRLLGGGGVDGAIHRAAGTMLLEECRTLNGCETGQSKITGGYELPAKFVIHTVGPIGEKPDLLRSAYKTSLDLAIANDVRTIAFPCISTGVYGYPQSNAANVVLEYIRGFLEKNPDKFDRIIFCVFLPEDVEIYEALLQIYFPVTSETPSKIQEL